MYKYMYMYIYSTSWFMQVYVPFVQFYAFLWASLVP